MSIREQIREYLIKLLHANKDYVTSLADNESLVLSGRLSSLDVVDTLTFLEETFHFEMNPVGFSQAKFDTVDRIMALLLEEGVDVTAASAQAK